MNDFELFQSALDIEDPAARKSFLQSACQHDAGLLERVEALLASHEGESLFLQTPVGDQLASGPSGTADTIYIGDGSTQDEPASFSLGPAAMAEQDDAEDEVPLGFLQPSTRADSLGRLAHYEILEVVGRGAFGTVLRAFDEKLHRVVAIKVMALELASTSPARKRFIREAQASAAIRHEHVVSVYAVEEKPIPYLVMEYIPGQTLQQRLHETGPLDIATVLRLGAQIAEGLAAAHAKDLIHRDIKPGNILLETGVRDWVKITDFGLARAADDASMTQSGQIAGTPMYMAPEQALGSKLDQRADLFSLGSVLYQMVSGRPPFRAANTLAVLKRLTEEQPRPIQEIIPETPQWLCAIIDKLHAKNPDERYQSAQEVADVLSNCESQLKEHSKLKDLSLIPHAKQRSTGWWKWAVATAMALPLLALGAYFATRLGSEPKAAQHFADPLTPVVAAPPNQGWTALFNGQDLTGWKTHPEQPGTWNVQDGILIGSSQQSHLFTERADFTNFHLRAEVKINRGGDSGIRFRVPFKLLRGKEAWQVIPAGGYEAEFTKLGYASAEAGSVWRVTQAAPPNTLFRSVDKAAIKPDVWHTYEVIADGNHFITRLDGKEVADCTDSENLYSQGQIALQCFSPQTRVEFRKIEIQELTASLPASSPPLAIAPFDAAQAEAYQLAWAKHLGVPVEYTNSIGMKFRLIPLGEFLMGASDEEIERALVNVTQSWQVDRTKAEGPQRSMTIREPYYLGQFEVTLGQFRQFVQETGYKTTAETNGKGGERHSPSGEIEVSPDYLWSNPIDSETDDHPVVFMSIEDARQFCSWLTRKDGRRYAVPRDDRWEFACRAGTTTWWFDEDVQRIAWTRENSESRLHPIGQKAANPFGLCDMHGNAGELCEAVLPKKVARRGGQATSKAISCRSASRWEVRDALPWYRQGFRVAIVGDLKPAGSIAKQEPLSPTFTNKIGMEFALVPKGKSWLGGGKDKPGDKEVEIPADFYLGKYEVTQEEWEQVMGENPSEFSRTGRGKDKVEEIPDADLKRFPVEFVSWDQCQLFLATLNRREKETGWVYRLPKNSEWEYACRGGPLADKADSGFDYYLDKPSHALPPERANFGNRLQRPCKVGSFAPNTLGLFDMHGNVAEWCDEPWDPDTRVLHGGCWSDNPKACTAVFGGILKRRTRATLTASDWPEFRPALLRQQRSRRRSSPPSPMPTSSGSPRCRPPGRSRRCGRS